MSLKITATSTICNDIEIPTALIADLLVVALGANWAAHSLYMGGDWNSPERGAERAANLYAMPSSGMPIEMLGSKQYSALIRAISSKPEFTLARAGEAPIIVGEFKRRIDAAIGDKTDSLEREASYLLRLAVAGTALSAEQLADAALLDAINAWETAMINKRDELIEANDTATALIDATWPPPPAGLAEFLKKGW